jgi:transposase InsO family protein
VGPFQAVTTAPTGAKSVCHSHVIDLYSRRVLGWALATHLRAELVCDALSMAVATRGGRVDGVVFHSDRGFQYTSRAFRRLCVRPSLAVCLHSASSADV